MYFIYRNLTCLAAPFVPLLLKSRLAKGKEDAARMQERFGIASQARPEGKLLWIHAASVGESNSVLPLINALLSSYPSLNILLTTVTVTSAELMNERLPSGAIHQFAPVDTPVAVEKFLQHWKPDVALWVDSELWPNIIMETKKRGTFMGIINARMSEHSFRAWQLASGFAKTLLSCFTLCFAQSRQDSERLTKLGIPSITGIGNLKYDAPELPFDEAELAALKEVIGNRPLWVAASTHPGEETIIAGVHKAVKERFADLLTIIVPRHANRGSAIAAELRNISVARRSKGDAITSHTDIYLADTMGELGLFYRLAPITFIGGTLTGHGGQSPLEAARLGSTIMMGKHYENFTAVVEAMERDKALMIVAPEECAAALAQLLSDSTIRSALGLAAKKHVDAGGGIINSIMKGLQPYLT